VTSIPCSRKTRNTGLTSSAISTKSDLIHSLHFRSDLAERVRDRTPVHVVANTADPANPMANRTPLWSAPLPPDGLRAVN
jgi:hypothetical protein